MDSASAVIGTFQPNSPRLTDTPDSRERDTTRCTYGRQVARALAELLQDESDGLELDSVRRRIRRWCAWTRLQGDGSSTDHGDETGLNHAPPMGV